ncbi:MAG: hypothetical protein PSV16_07300 [Flavobacterium sp.]|nr:hypothetical protein [Flavobacterium sp.]
MKKFLFLFLVVFALNGCNDGDLEVESFDFSTVNTQKCNLGSTDPTQFYLFKVNGKEALIIQIPEADFPNIVTPEGAPRSYDIAGSIKVIYRLYDADINTETICSAIPSSTPNVVSEWNAIGGTIEVTTSAVNPINETTGATVITKYSHTITFKNIVFDRGNGTEQNNDSITFGTYETPALQPVAFDNIDINDCASNNLLFKYSGLQALTLNLDAATYADLFANEVTTTDAPRTALISATNKLNYRVFETGLTLDYFCATTTPTTPVLKEIWEGETGVDGVSGIIEVETTTNGPNFVHTIRFKNVTYKNNATTPLEFSLGTNYLFGEFVTPG